MPTYLATATTTPAALAAIAALALLAALTLVVVWRRMGSRRVLVAASFGTVLAFNAEGMWVVATKRLHLPAAFAGGVFAVFEIMLLAEMSLAAEHYRRTTVRDPETGKIIKSGHPGKHGRAVFLLATVSGVIVAFNSASLVEALLRLTLPLLVALLWWNVLTAEGTGRPTSTFAWSPRRIAQRAGLLVPDADDDLDALSRERRIRAMVNVGQRAGAGLRPRRWHLWRLNRLARTADDGMVTEALARQARVATVVAALAPTETPDRATDTPATAPATRPAIVAPATLAIGPVTAPATAVATPPATVATDKTPPAPPAEMPASAITIAKLRAKVPNITQAKVIERTGLSDRTVSRWWRHTAPAAPTQKTNGYAVAGPPPSTTT